jgi:hypothetical protein
MIKEKSEREQETKLHVERMKIEAELISRVLDRGNLSQSEAPTQLDKLDRD